MGQSSTRERLLRSAETLMAKEGIDEVSVRAITEHAGANVAAVNYHFGGKQELVQDVLRTRFARLDALMVRSLRQLSKEQSAEGEEIPNLQDVVGVYFETLINVGLDRDNHAPDPFIMLIRRASTDHGDALETAQNLEAPGISRLVEMLGDSVGVPLTIENGGRILIDLLFGGSVEAIQTIVSRPRNDPDVDRAVAAIKDYTAAGAQGFLNSLFGPKPIRRRLT